MMLVVGVGVAVMVDFGSRSRWRRRIVVDVRAQLVIGFTMRMRRAAIGN